MWGNNNMIKHSLIKAALGLALAVGLGAGLCHSIPEARAQTEETFHRQNNSDAQVHAQGTVETRPFYEAYLPPDSISSFGPRLDWLFAYTTWIGILFFIIVVGILGYCLVKFRAGKNRKAYYTHGKNTFWERWIPVIGALAVFFSVDLVLETVAHKHMTEFVWNYPSGPDVVRVQVMPQQWVWNFRYPGKDDVFGTDDDITTINELRVPEGRRVMTQIMSRDVIHGFFITKVRAQVDAIPGSVIRFWFDANKTGDYEITCAHLCGTAHYKMKGFLKVMDDGAYHRWYDEASDWAKAAYDPNDPSIKWGWNWSLNEKK